MKSISSINSITTKIDKWLLHRFLGIPFFLAFMYLVFAIIILGGGQIQLLISDFLNYWLIDKVAATLLSFDAPSWTIALLSAGLGQGLYITLSFIPIIALMFFCLSFLEGSGYMARAAFVMDKLMHYLGLSGKSFMPMVLGFGCNVPAILGARSLENPKERIMTILMTPFMSCGARLAIYALFVAAFFPEGGTNVIFGLYFIGILVALFTGFILRRILLAKDESTPLTLELPSYRWPKLKWLLSTTRHRVQGFVLKAGVIIIPLCMLIGSLGMLKTEHQESYLTALGRQLTPIFAPIGIEPDNWPATVGLLSGVLAKEVVVGTLSSLYAESAAEMHQRNPNSNTNSNTLGVMAKRFGSPVAAFAYLLFVLLYFPCVSVLATIARELRLTWALFSAVWSTGIAYAVSVLFYQTATLQAHPTSSMVWIGGVLTILALGVMVMQAWARRAAAKKPSLIPTRIVLLGS